ncbi:hypothetical protein [Phenylobacterium sp. J367]|uniref:hypothetical protein n=1 Tax=Phenylobacterium sp. J367 TaxID=2898435 RepID=UPI002150AD77|nr:hypothetical protein [Phenylobacterium sp. J367]MCR5877643.1 hypothetical protein [Phenylobacterium sp. J367]
MEIHPTAQVAQGAQLDGVAVGPFAIVHAGVRIGPGSKIGAYCEIGHPTAGEASGLVIGANANIRSHSVIYQGAEIGEGLATGHRVVIRERSLIGRNAQIGSNADIQGDCRLGDFFRSQSNIFIAKGSRVGDFVWMLPYAVLTNDPSPPSELTVGCEIGDYAVLSAGAMVLPGVKVGAHAVIAAQSLVSRDVPAGMLVMGTPARVVGPADERRLPDGSGRAAYPWPGHFRRGYPPGTFD